MLSVIDCETKRAFADQVRPAHTHWTRMKGLLGTKSLADGEGLWIKPCNQVHMYFMRYAVDLVFLDRALRVVKMIEAQPVNSLSPKIADAESVIEFPVGTIARAGIREGSQLEVTGEADNAAANWLETLGAFASNLLMAGFYCLFVYANLRGAHSFERWATSLPIVLQEAMLIFLFLTRRRSKEVSNRPLDWVFGIAGTALPLFLRPNKELSSMAWAAEPFLVLGLVLAVLGTFSLGRSFGVVAGNRGVKTSGMHGFVRHPLYMGYLISYCAYVVVHPSSYNLIILAATFIALNYRAVAEERFLARDEIYRAYLERVRWRFVPFVY